MTYDSKCYDLALYFLSDDPPEMVRDSEPLAIAIQQAVEGWLAENPICSICRSRHPSDDHHSVLANINWRLLP